MVGHIVRWFAATLNLFLSGMLAWSLIDSEWTGINGDPIAWLVLVSSTIAPIASAYAGVLLVRRRTFAMGLKWHGIVGICLGVMFVAIILETIREMEKYRSMPSVSDCLPLIILAAIFSIWPILSIVMNAFLRREGAVQASLLRSSVQNNGFLDVKRSLTPDLVILPQEDEPVILQNCL